MHSRKRRMSFGPASPSRSGDAPVPRAIERRKLVGRGRFRFPLLQNLDGSLQNLVAACCNAGNRAMHLDVRRNTDCVMLRSVVFQDSQSCESNAVPSRQAEKCHVAVRSCRIFADNCPQLVILYDSHQCLEIADRSHILQKHDWNIEPRLLGRNFPVIDVEGHSYPIGEQYRLICPGWRVYLGRTKITKNAWRVELAARRSPEIEYDAIRARELVEVRLK